MDEIIFDRKWQDRFWAKVDKVGNPGGCWLWMRSLDKDGYGQVAVGLGVGRIQRAHRVAYAIVHGEVPPLLDHFTCYDRQCVFPEHLRPATRAENAANQKPIRRAQKKLVSTKQALEEDEEGQFIVITKRYKIISE